ncbi:to cell cycle control protein Cwf19 [Geosmithia morbida]|uniref:To cell cycle control protein Cwf19 n=1 Tax=Geosmithia morbida TaxID=1094350 RepID=A0A9P4YV37_9HYPO|nr:to cell cycle control protein Cwf19 [Geosmithia morbida]KAF4122261.1 to cell cycle control protein Cwf19 [Geosmithia morbida]
MDGLDEFEKSLAAAKAQRSKDEGHREHKHRHGHHRRDDDKHADGHHHHRHHREHRDDKDDERRHRRRHRDDEHHDGRMHKRSRQDDNDDDGEDKSRRHRRDNKKRSHDRSRDPKEELPVPDDEKPSTGEKTAILERDSWMTAPSALEVDYIHRARPKTPPRSPPRPQRVIHDRELNRGVDSGAAGQLTDAAPSVNQRTVEYTFGDAGSSWRMTKLRTVFREADESGRTVEDVALERFGNLKDFDDAREEKEEMERRRVYGAHYDNKEKPTGELYQERVRAVRKVEPQPAAEPPTQGTVTLKQPAAMDQTALNRLRAQMMKAKMRRAPNASQLEEEYNRAAANFSPAVTASEPGTAVIGAMESRQLAGTRGEVKVVETRRGRERGNVVENDDMTIDDMVREERRTKGSGEGMRQAERIARDAKYTDDLDYMDDNAAKLARRVHKSEANLKNMAVSEYQKLNRALDRCPLCHDDSTGRQPVAPVVSLATRTFLTLPTEPEVSPGGAVIVPSTHRANLIECDDDEWEELRNFMKSLTRMYHAQGRDVVFYENAANPGHHRHAAMVAVPVPYDEGAMAPAHFREAFLSSDAEWSQHRPVIDTAKAAADGMGRAAFRRSMPKEMPYFHAWFSLDGGLGHIVEDGNRWPKGDLFAREVVGGIVGADPHIVKKQGRWSRGDRDSGRVQAWKKEWRKFDWTRVLEEA